MSIPGSASPLFFTAAADAAAFTLEKSVRFNSADSAYLNRTPSSTGNRRTWTWSSWVKFCKDDTNNRTLFSTGTNSSTSTELRVLSSGYLNLGHSGSTIGRTDMVLRDTSAWYHIVCAFDSTQSVQADRIKIYVNGVLQSLSTSSCSLNLDSFLNHSGTAYKIGAYYDNDPNYFLDGYLADTYLIDGSALDATSFGAFDANGVWQAAAYSGSFGTNGFHLFDFANESGIGNDSSGNDNDFTANNLQADGLFVNQGFTNPGNAFDGNTGTYAEVTTSGALGQFIFPGGISVSSSVKIKYSSSTSGNVYLNGSATALAGTGAQEHNITFSGTLNTIGIQSSSQPVIYYVDIDNNGTYLTGGAAEDQDVLLDVPTNGTQSDTGAGGEVSGNYATLNPLDFEMSAGSISNFVTNGNLTKTDVLNTYGKVRATMPVHFGGKTYFEVNVSGAPAGADYIGFEPSDKAIVSANGFSSGDLGFRATGYKSPGGASYGSAWSDGDVLGFYFDDETSGGIVGYYLNGVDQGTAWSSFDQSKQYLIAIQDWSNGATAVFDFNFGQRPFVYSNPGTNRPSADFKPLCTTFMPTPTIADGSDYFEAKTFTSNNGSQSITLGFSPDLVWTKSRSVSYEGQIFDAVRGDNQEMSPNATRADRTLANSLTFDSSGFTMPSANNNANYGTGGSSVAWAWDAGSSTASNTDGDITSSVRANQTAGFSIVSYTGNGTAGETIGHGLNAAPEMIIVKNRDSALNWVVGHQGLDSSSPWTKNLYLNATSAASTLTAIWNNTAPTSSVFTVGASSTTNNNGSDYIAYCFAPVAGHSAFGSYEANSDANGPFVYTGFRVAWLMIKATTSGNSNTSWYIFDTTRELINPNKKYLLADSAAAEGNFHDVDLLSNGFKIRANYDGTNNTSRDPYIYAAFAENPFQANGGLAR